MPQKIFSNEQAVHRDKEQTLKVLPKYRTRKVAPSRSDTLLIATAGAQNQKSNCSAEARARRRAVRMGTHMLMLMTNCTLHM